MADVVVVGGGIGGSALGAVLARRGQSVTVLEHQRVYADRVRGEFMAPWGAAIAQRLGLLDALVEAGGIFTRFVLNYDEVLTPAQAEAGRTEHANMFPGIPGSLCMYHPAACEALNRQAQLAGARVFRGVDRVRIELSPEPTVTYRIDGADVRLPCRLIVGADGRTSTVRQQAGIELHEGECENLVTGLLVEGPTEWPQDSFALGTEGDRMYLVFPQGGDRLRLYLGIAPNDRDRFAGPEGAARLLDAFRLRCVPQASSIAHARPIGPCATWGGEDTWTDPPFAEGVVLIGDAAGYNNPIIGQGLSLTLRDVEVVSELLLSQDAWTPASFQPYADERRERMRRVRFNADLFAALFCTFGAEGAQRRGSWMGRMASGQDPTMVWVVAGILAGPDVLPPAAYDDAFRERVLSGAAPA
jgi:2-polyprenyl-6-methoxyphenol hydroxylase-like FAD-dependent oxidoreductase